MVTFWKIQFTSVTFKNILFIDFKERGGGKREKHLFLVPLTRSLVDSLTGDRTCNVGVSGQRSNRMSFPARAPQ